MAVWLLLFGGKDYMRAKFLFVAAFLVCLFVPLLGCAPATPAFPEPSWTLEVREAEVRVGDSTSCIAPEIGKSVSITDELTVKIERDDQVTSGSLFSFVLVNPAKPEEPEIWFVQYRGGPNNLWVLKPGATDFGQIFAEQEISFEGQKIATVDALNGVTLYKIICP